MLIENLVIFLVMSRSWQFPDQKFELEMDASAANGQKNCSKFGHVTIVTVSGPKVQAQNGRVCCKWAKKLVKVWSCHDRNNFRTKSSSSKWTTAWQRSKKVDYFLVMSRSWEFLDQKFELKMDDSMANGQKSWSDFGPVTIVTISLHQFSWQTPDKKTRSVPDLDHVKMDDSMVNEFKSRCILVALSLAKQPPRGPFARELRNQTGGN